MAAAARGYSAPLVQAERLLRGPLRLVPAVAAAVGPTAAKVGPHGPCSAARDADTFNDVSQTQTFLWILALFMLEVQHLKWIWWEHWACRCCSTKHKDCACGSTARWVMFL